MQFLRASGLKRRFDTEGRACLSVCPFKKMRLLRVILIGLLLTGAVIFGRTAMAAGTPAEAEAATHKEHAASEEHSLAQHAVEVGRPFGFPITNSMVVTWIVAIGLIVFAQVATRNMKEIPEGAQNFWEWMVERSEERRV